MLGGLSGFRKNAWRLIEIHRFRQGWNEKGWDQEFLSNLVETQKNLKWSFTEHRFGGIEIPKTNKYARQHIKTKVIGQLKKYIGSNDLCNYEGQAGFAIDPAYEYWNGKSPICEKLQKIEKKYKDIFNYV